MAKYKELTKNNFDSVVSKGLSFVDFWAPWCGPCRMLSPIIDELADQYDGRVNICKVNTDEEEDLATRFGIRSIPTMMFFVDGQVKDTLVGGTSKQSIVDKIESLLNS